jgi:MoaA/NifB/PqqE/SkfB family radical SAM enzyme
MSLKSRYREAMSRLTDAPGANGKLPFIINDLVIEEQLCNLKCSYCLTENFSLLMAVPDAFDRLKSNHVSKWMNVIHSFHKTVDAPVLRVSGGEFLWMRYACDFLEEVSEHYEVVQLITNAVPLKENKIERLAKIKNFHLNFSLDGHTCEMNIHRFPNPSMLDIVLRNLDMAVTAGMPAEVQMVLTDANTPQICEFAGFLAERYAGLVRLFPFPVRGSTGHVRLTPNSSVSELAARYDEFESVLPPRPFLDHIGAFVAEPRRQLPCMIPATMVQLFGDGSFSACPHAWIEKIGNVVEAEDAVVNAYCEHGHYSIFLQPRPRNDFCRRCATPSDVLNLYLLGQIEDRDLDRTFLYRGPRTRQRLRDVRDAFSAAFSPTTPVAARAQAG